MPDDERDHLLKRLEALERQSEQLDVELLRLRRDLLRHKGAAAVPPAAPAQREPAAPPPAAAKPEALPEAVA